MPAIAIDSLMAVFMLSNALGAEPFVRADEVMPATEGVRALEMLRELVHLSAPGSLQRNPIQTWQMLADSESVAYCPFAYGYSNYSRVGYAAHAIRVGGLVSFEGKTLRSTLGGAGLAISRRTQHVEQALKYAEFTAGAAVQKTLYAYAGGQPGHRGAWTDAALNEATGDFFANTLDTLDAAWVRPRFPGFIRFQDRASALVHEYLAAGGDARRVIDEMNAALLRERKNA